jgi:Uma2 family endonuclease
MQGLPVVVPADWVSGPPQGQWTYDAYAAIPDDGKIYEVVKGVLYMSPSPTPPHQNVGAVIVAYLCQYVQFASLGEIFYELDVELSSGTVVKPDVLVLLNAHLDRKNSSRIVGAPDLAVEILSPSTMRQDVTVKYEAYAEAGVPEYWIVNPAEQIIELFYLENGVYKSAGLFQGSAVLPSRVVPSWSVPVGKLFSSR